MDDDSQATKEAMPHTPVTVSIKNHHCDKELFTSLCMAPWRDFSIQIEIVREGLFSSFKVGYSLTCMQS